MSTKERLRKEFLDRELSPWEIAEREAAEYEASFRYCNDDTIPVDEKGRIPDVLNIW